ncbi:Serine/threonine-protein kinase/endoribonuclease IRE1 [Geodia barretti]|nr:Serine/threonine-protein kinase/endoribonuclease IRE1 [Geodia barretti]
MSPMRSADGLLYTAMKSDMWMEIDRHSGKKLHTISSEGSMSSCPATETYTRSFFIARTAYTLRVYDSVTKEKRWDATYLEYNSYSSTPTINRDHLYFSSTTDDMLISIDPNTGNSTIYCTFGNLNLRSKEI